MFGFQAISVAQSTMARDYVECCAKTRWNVKEVFKSAADAILHKDDDKVEETKSQSVLRKFSWFTRRSSGSDVSDYNNVPRSPSSSRRLSLFSTSWQKPSETHSPPVYALVIKTTTEFVSSVQLLMISFKEDLIFWRTPYTRTNRCEDFRKKYDNCREPDDSNWCLVCPCQFNNRQPSTRRHKHLGSCEHLKQ